VNLPTRPGVLRIGDRVRLGGTVHTITALTGMSVRLVAESGHSSVVLLTHLLSAADFEALDAPAGPGLPRLGLLDGLPSSVVARARAWERHVVEVDTGLPPDAPAGARPRPDYDPARRSLRQRETAKAAELTAAGEPTSPRTVQRLRLRYRSQGLLGLVDRRAMRPVRPLGNTDPRLVAAIVMQLDQETTQSTGTRGRLRRRVEATLTAEHGQGMVALPSKATFNRLVGALSAGRHTFGSAVTRRSQANRPERPFTPTLAARPGEQVQIDTSPLDVAAVFEDGVTGRVELTMAVDVATRTICAAILRPVSTKAVDAALLLARMVVPEPMRPGWAQALSMAHARIPHQRLLSLDARVAQAAAKPVIVPDTIVCDRHRVFLSEAFLRACQTLGISVQPAHPATPTDKSVIERTFESVNTLFCQHVAGYVGASVTMRGTRAHAQAVWSIADLQELLDEWIVAGWQSRPHDSLRDPHLPGRALSPNEMFAALVAAAGYLPVSLAGDDYVELLPAAWRSIQDYGIRIDYRTYDTAALNPYRRLPSGVAAKRGLWEVHYDPYDLGQVWVRDHHAGGGWIIAPWTHQPMLRMPFADFTWRRARQLVADRGRDATDETEIANALAELLRRADAGPAPEARIAARTRASAATTLLLSPTALPQVEGPDEELTNGPPDAGDDEEPLAEVIPFGIFDPLAEDYS
jgi:hypothetical protein